MHLLCLRFVGFPVDLCHVDLDNLLDYTADPFGSKLRGMFPAIAAQGVTVAPGNKTLVVGEAFEVNDDVIVTKSCSSLGLDGVLRWTLWMDACLL